MSYAHGHTDYDTLSSQHSRKGVPQLAQVRVETLVVDAGTFTVGSAASFEDVTERLRTLNQSGEAFWLTAAHALPTSLSGVGPELQMYATLRSVSVSERAGEPDARYFSLAFSEYRTPLVPRAGRSKPQRWLASVPAVRDPRRQRHVAVAQRGGHACWPRSPDLRGSGVGVGDRARQRLDELGQR